MENINENPGIYFEPTGTVRTISDFLHVLVPIDISYIQPHIDNLRSILGTSRFLCKQNEAITEFECHVLLQPLVSRLDDIIRDYGAISHLISIRDKRSAWFAGIGTIFKKVIGTMDEEDAIRYNNAIQTLDKHDKNLAHLLKDNIFMTQTALSHINELFILLVLMKLV